MGLPESATSHSENQERGGRRGRRRRKPRPRRCLLKGCEQKYRPSHARQRYCSAACRKAAEVWKRRKSQQKYRATAKGKEKRQRQSRHYRERVGHRKAQSVEAVGEVARVIPKKFFRGMLRPAGLLRGDRTAGAVAAPAILLGGVPSCDGARVGARAALAA